MQITTDYKNEQITRLKGFPFNKLISFDTKAHDYKQKVAAIKIIIDWGQDKDNGFELTFNDNFTKLIKYKLKK